MFSYDDLIRALAPLSESRPGPANYMEHQRPPFFGLSRAGAADVSTEPPSRGVAMGENPPLLMDRLKSMAQALGNRQ